MPSTGSQKEPEGTLSRLDWAKRLALLVWATIGFILLILGAGYLLSRVWTAIIIVIFAALLVFILRAPVDWLEKHKVPRWLAVIVAYLASFLIVTLVLLIFIPMVWQQVIGLLELIPGYVTQASAFLGDFYNQYSYLLEDSNIQQVFGGVASEISNWAVSIAQLAGSNVINIGTNVVTAVIIFVVSLVVGFWILKDLNRIGQELLVIIGPKRREDARFISSACSRALGGYLRGMLVAGTCTGLISGIGYYFIGLPYPAVLGLLTGLMNFIPYVGPWISGIIVALIGLFISPLTALLAIAITIIAQQVTDNFITPRVMSSAVELHPCIVLVGVFAGGALGGLFGLVAAIPILAAAKSIFVYYFERHTGRKLLSENGAFFRSKSARLAELSPQTDAAQEASPQPDGSDPPLGASDNIRAEEDKKTRKA
ncbi:MAG: AI-2E family transporter [Coriobacteriales bacterium]|jgi:predicted PurR-regulated permease PerM|nr:AI-2E family transporter [Coriobacteriales bacterium]